MCPAAYGTINNPSVGAGVPDGPFFRTSCNPTLRKRFHISVGGGRPCPPARKALLVTLRRGDPRGRPPAMHHTPWKPCHCEVSAHTGRGNPHLSSPKPPLPKERGILAGYGVFVCRKLVRGFPQKETAFSGGLRLSKNPPGFSDKRLAVCCAHNLSVCDGQIPHWQPELYFLSRTCRERK